MRRHQPSVLPLREASRLAPAHGIVKRRFPKQLPRVLQEARICASRHPHAQHEVFSRSLVRREKLDLSVMLFTHVLGQGSLFVYYGPLSYIMKDVIKTQFDRHSGFDPDIISRKQQMMPKLSELIRDI